MRMCSIIVTAYRRRNRPLFLSSGKVLLNHSGGTSASRRLSTRNQIFKEAEPINPSQGRFLGDGHEPEVSISRDAPPNHDGGRRKDLLPRGRSQGRPNCLAVARLPDVLAHVPQSDPVPGGALSRYRARLSRLRPKRRARLQVVSLYFQEVW